MEHYKKCVPFLLAFCAAVFNLSAQQQKIDSLLKIVQIAKEDTNKVIALNELAVQYRQIGNSEKGIQYEKIAIPLAKQLNYKKGEARANGNMGLLLNDLGRLDEAANHHRIALTIRENIGDRQGSGNSYTNLGHIHYDLGNFDSAKYFYMKTLKIREELKDEYGLANCYNDLGNVSKILGSLSDALTYQVNSLKIREKINDQYGVVDSYGNIGGVYSEQSNFPEALKNYKKSLEYAEPLNYKRPMINAFTGIGNIHNRQGNLPEALKNFLSALRISKEINNKRGISMCHDNIGIVLAKQKNYKEAQDNFLAAIAINDKTGDKYGQIRSYTNLGTIYYEQANSLIKQNKNDNGNLDSANKYFTRAIVISKEIGDKEGIAMSYFNLGLTIRKKRHFAESLSNYRSALAIFEERGEKYGVAKSLIGIADVLIDSAKAANSSKLFQQALTNVNKGCEIAQTLEANELISDAYETIAEGYKGLKDYQQALRYLTLHTALKDTLLNSETAKKIETLRLQYEVEVAIANEQVKQEKQKATMQLEFDRREDSIKYQQKLISLQLEQQTFISKQHEQDLKLKQAALELLDQQNELSRSNYLRSQAELAVEQASREEKEKELTISQQEKSLQNTQLNLQKTQLDLKENQIKAEKRQQLFYIGGIVLLLLLFVLIYRNIKNRQRTERLVATERLKTEKANAAHTMAELELQSLRAQLNPHFMFNSLNAIQELILKEDNDNSHLYLSRFAELLRMLLDNANQPFVPLRKELNLLELYLSLEQLRVPDLKYSIEIDKDVDVNKMTIPNMMLQPYIENAIWHGLSHKKGEKNVFLRISKKGDGVICKVEDNGVGRKVSSELKSLYRKEHRSKGMELLSKRFNLLSKEYGSDIQTDIEDLHDNGTATGTKVTILLPHSLTAQTKPVYS